MFVIRTISAAAEIQDAEAATHGDAAALYQIIQTYEFPEVKIIQLELAVLSHYSYLVISDGDCLVVDPGRDISTYLALAKKEGATIQGVWLSHSHADFIAGHMEFIKQLDVPIYISQRAGAGFVHKPLKEGATIEVGQAVLTLLETPGHTLDSMCAVVSSKQNPGKPLVLFSGDTLFIGSVGRPDLMGGDVAASSLASMMFDTWTKKLSKLPDDVLVLPAHGAGSLCGAHLSDQPSSTIGQQRVENAILRQKSRGEFIAAILEGLPVAPQYFAHDAAINRKGPEPVDWNPASPPWVEPSAELTDPSKYYVVDLRDAKSFAAGHIPNSVNIGLRGRLETWTGIMVPWDAQLVVAGSEEELKEAVYRLHRVGFRPKCVSFDQWKEAGLPLKQSELIEPRALYALMQSPESPVIVDVRLPSEWMALRIGATVNLPLNELAADSGKLDRSQHLVAVCNSAYRSSMAVGVLQRQGFEHVASMDGGTEAWVAAGLPVLEAKTEGVTGTAPKRVVKLAERISADELKRMLMDLPGTFQLVDIRPAAYFADYHLPGSQNVDVAEVIGNPAYLTRAGPLIIVDRDGSLAMMVGGILSQKTERSVKVLFGGLEAYWSASIPSAGACPAGSPDVSVPVSPGPMTTPAVPPAAPPTGASKKKSAGC